MTVELSRIFPGRLLQWGNTSCVSEPGKKCGVQYLEQFVIAFLSVQKLNPCQVSAISLSIQYRASKPSFVQVQRSKHTLFWLLSACRIWISRTKVRTTRIRLHVRYAWRFTLTLIRSKVKSTVLSSRIASGRKRPILYFRLKMFLAVNSPIFCSQYIMRYLLN